MNKYLKFQKVIVYLLKNTHTLKTKTMNIQKKIFLKSITSDVKLLIKTNYNLCLAPKCIIFRKDYERETLSKHRMGATYRNEYFETFENGVVRGMYTTIDKSDVPLFWKNPFSFNYNFRLAKNL